MSVDYIGNTLETTINSLIPHGYKTKSFDFSKTIQNSSSQLIGKPKRIQFKKKIDVVLVESFKQYNTCEEEKFYVEVQTLTRESPCACYCKIF